MPRATRYDAIVIGTGQGGVPLAKSLARAGWKTAIVEKEQVGGSCVNHGCTPTKTMVASARVAHLARSGTEFGVRVGKVSVDMEHVRRRKREIVRQFRAGSESGIASTPGLRLVRGHARFVGPHEILVEPARGPGRRLQADHVFINTGLRPRTVEIPGLAGVRVLDSTTIMELDHVPRRLVVVGGGYVGLEFAQMFRRFGSAVTVVQRGRHLLPREDEDVSAAVEEILREDGIKVLLRAEVRRVARSRARIQVTVAAGRQERRILADEILVAAGRVPNTDDLGAQAAGIELDEDGHVAVNARLETSVPGVYALGDVKGGPAFTHISWDDYRILEANLLHGKRRTTRDRRVPYVVYIDPELGRIGPTEAEARKERGRRIRVATLPMTAVARALEADETRGFMKIVVDAKSDRILGAAVLGLHGGEVMSAIEIAMMGGLTWKDLRDATFAHPTLVEALNNAFGGLED